MNKIMTKVAKKVEIEEEEGGKKGKLQRKKKEKRLLTINNEKNEYIWRDKSRANTKKDINRNGKEIQMKKIGR